MIAGIGAYKYVTATKVNSWINEYNLKIIYYSEMAKTGDFKEKHVANIHGKTKEIITPLPEYDRVLNIIKKYPELITEGNLEKILELF